jgi:MtrB/PioB family decaheme-associated outer membrane protein
MRTFGSWFLLGTLSAAASSAANAVDTSQWKCESCPFEKEQFSASVEGGLGTVSESSAKFGDFTGLDKKGGYLVLGGDAKYRGPGGAWGTATASDLGLDSRSVEAEGGMEGRFALRLGYSEIPRHFTDNALTPFQGNGGSVLTLPAGYPALDTGSMPLSSTLQPVEIGYNRKRFDLGGQALAGTNWSIKASWRRDTRDGTLPTSGSFFSSASQLAAPVDQTTDQFELATSYFTRRLQATLSAQLSLFKNNQNSLTWSNPFLPIVTGGDTGQLALPPDNKFWQITGSAGYEVTPWLRASGEFAAGRMQQDAGYLAPTLNASLAPADQLALPAQSLNGRVDTFNSAVRLTATPTEPLRINGTWTRDVRDNKTPSLSYPAVSTDTFLDPVPRTNQPFSYRTDRYKLNGDYHGPGTWKTSLGVDYEERMRTLQEVVYTRETTFWGQVGAQLPESVAWWLKLAHADRSSSTYGIATWVDPPENPLLRKYNLAERSRNEVKARGEWAVMEAVTIGLNYELDDDDYSKSTIGLLDGRTQDFGADVAWAISEKTRLFGYAQTERINSRQAGSQLFSTPDWYGYNKDQIDVFGLGIKHTAALKGKLDLGADFTLARSRSDVTVDAGPTEPPFPTTKTSRETLKLWADYRVKDNLSVIANYWYDHYTSQDWHLDGVQPGTIPNLLAFGEQPPHYRVHVFSVSLRYYFH